MSICAARGAISSRAKALTEVRIMSTVSPRLKFIDEKVEIIVVPLICVYRLTLYIGVRCN